MQATCLCNNHNGSIYNFHDPFFLLIAAHANDIPDGKCHLRILLLLFLSAIHVVTKLKNLFIIKYTGCIFTSLITNL